MEGALDAEHLRGLCGSCGLSLSPDHMKDNGLGAEARVSFHVPPPALWLIKDYTSKSICLTYFVPPQNINE